MFKIMGCTHAGAAKVAGSVGWRGYTYMQRSPTASARSSRNARSRPPRAAAPRPPPPPPPPSHSTAPSQRGAPCRTNPTAQRTAPTWEMTVMASSLVSTMNCTRGGRRGASRVSAPRKEVRESCCARARPLCHTGWQVQWRKRAATRRRCGEWQPATLHPPPMARLRHVTVSDASRRLGGGAYAAQGVLAGRGAACRRRRGDPGGVQRAHVSSWAARPLRRRCIATRRARPPARPPAAAGVCAAKPARECQRLRSRKSAACPLLPPSLAESPRIDPLGPAQLHASAYCSLSPRHARLQRPAAAPAPPKRCGTP